MDIIDGILHVHDLLGFALGALLSLVLCLLYDHANRAKRDTMRWMAAETMATSRERNRAEVQRLLRFVARSENGGRTTVSSEPGSGRDPGGLHILGLPS